jgi:CheY-like chemotaxis protein
MQKRILWIDDEIEFLRSHIVFLETRGYAVTPASGGDEAVRLIKESRCAYDIVLLDKQMPVKSGNATFDEIRAFCPELPIVMVTGYQHSSDAAAKKKFDGYLTKPIDPGSLLLMCKQIIELRQQASRRLTDRYLRSYTENQARAGGVLSASGWMEHYAALAKWDIEIEGVENESVRQLHAGLRSDSGRKFCDFAAAHYAEWVRGRSDPPLMSADVVGRVVVPELREGRSVLMAVLSGMRLDQFFAIEPELARYFSASRAMFMSALPSASEFCMAALAFGGHSDAAFECEPAAFGPERDAAAMKRLMRGGLERAGMGAEKIKTFYASADGPGGKRHIRAAADAMKKVRAFGMVAADVIGRFAGAGPAAGRPKETASQVTVTGGDAELRGRVADWFAGSDILGMLREACGGACTVILTSDHGHVSCGRASEVYEAGNVGGAPRHLLGDRISVDEREAFLLEELPHFRLPPLASGAADPGAKRATGMKCAMARENYYFTHPGKPDGQRGRRPTAGGFRCGGISLEEMVMPLYICRPPGSGGAGGNGG